MAIPPRRIMALPQAVIDAAKKADEAMAALQKKENEPAAKTDDGEGTIGEENLVQTNTTETDKTQQAPEKDEVVVDSVTVTPPADTVKPTESTPTESTVDYEQRYNVLNGKYRAEVPALHQQVKKLTTELTKVQETLKESTTLKEEPRPIEQTLNPDSYKEYGEDFTKLVQVVTKLEAENQRLNNVIAGVSKDNTEIKTNQDTMIDSQANKATNDFYTTLSTAVPNWETVNTDPKWLQWLGEVDEISGKSKQHFLDKASSSLNSGQVIKLFKLYLTTVESKETQAKTEEKTRQIEQQTQPSKTNTSVAANAEPHIWTKAQIKDFYTRKQQGFFSKNPKRGDEIEKDIFLAMKQNRVRD